MNSARPTHCHGSAILASLHVRRAVSREDVESVYAVRWAGYRKYFCDPCQVREGLDASPQTLLLLATDADGRAVGTVRLCDRRGGRIELDNYLDLDQILPPERSPLADGSRLSVPHSSVSPWVKLALWKACFLYCRASGIRTMIASVRAGAVRDYQRLQFETLGPAGCYAYARLGNRPHETFVLDIPIFKARCKAANTLLYTIFHEEQHPNIRFE